jgi:hypothetical protein
MTTHLLALWNPSLGEDVMGAHLDLLLRQIREQKEEDEKYVWWGKLRSPNRLQPLGHLPKILALDGVAREGKEEVHLYLTDFRSLYVAHVGKICESDPRTDDSDHVPPYYFLAKPPQPADCWFQLWDIRRLVTSDTVAVASELRRLRNLHYHDNPVSIYGGMVDLPLMVRRADEERFFDEATEGDLLEGKRWAQWDAERSGTGAMERELRENVLGPAVWERLDPASRTFLATAEGLVRAHRDDAAFDFSTALVDFAKAMEVEVGRIVRSVLRGAADPLRFANVDGTPRDLAANSLALGQLARAISGDRPRMEWIRQRTGNWFVESLPPVLDDLAKFRNPASHGARLGAREVLKWRDQILGIGKYGLLEELAGCWKKLGEKRS